jgi:hypothetical protein
MLVGPDTGADMDSKDGENHHIVMPKSGFGF